MSLKNHFLTSALFLTGAVSSPDFAHAQAKERIHRMVVTYLDDTLSSESPRSSSIVKPVKHHEVKITPAYTAAFHTLYDALLSMQNWTGMSPADAEKGIFPRKENGWNCNLIARVMITRAHPHSKDPKENQVFIVDRIDAKADSAGYDFHTPTGGHIYRGIARQIMIEELKNDGKNSVIIYYREYDNAQDDRHSTPTPRTKAFRDAPSLNDTSVYEQISLQRFQEIVQAIKSEIHTAKSHFHEISKPLPPPFESAKPKKIKKPVRKK